jgi:hypothetical protein
MRTATGVTATAAPASRPQAAEPVSRLTAACDRATVATPSSACGTSMLQLLKPNSRPLISMGHRKKAGLSTVIALPASSEPNSIAFQLVVPACTAWA